MRTITIRLRENPKNPITNKTAAVRVYAQSGNTSSGIVSVTSNNFSPFCSFTKLMSVTDNVFIIMKNSIEEHFLGKFMIELHISMAVGLFLIVSIIIHIMKH